MPTNKKNAAKPKFSIETLLGPTLLAKANEDAKPTKTLMQGKDLVALYFSASWCPPCKTFSPLLTDFYCETAKENKLEVVYVGHDKTYESFAEYYGKMPWLSIPAEEGALQVKRNLGETLGVKGLPTLVVIDAKTGEFITASARTDVEIAGGDKEKANATVKQWKAMERKPLSEAASYMDGPGGGNILMKIVMFFAKNPIYVFALLYFYRFAKKTWNEGLPGGADDEPPEMGDEQASGEDASEF